jgi:hypothetical protein
VLHLVPVIQQRVLLGRLLKVHLLSSGTSLLKAKANCCSGEDSGPHSSMSAAAGIRVANVAAVAGAIGDMLARK